MIKDKRGVGGFMESMVAMMVVTIALSMFMTAFAYTNTGDCEVHDVSTDFLGSLSIEDGTIIGLDEDYLVEESERKGYRSMTVSIKVAGDLMDIELSSGTRTDGCDQIIRNGTFMLPSDDGGRYAAVYEVIAFV